MHDDMEAVKPLSSSRAPAFWLAAGAFCVVMLGTTLPTPLYPIYQQRFGFESVLITVIFAAYACAVMAGLLLFGHLSDEIGRRPVLAAGLIFSALSAFVFLTASDVPMLLIGRVLSGLSAGIFTGAGTAAVTELLPERRRSFATVVAVAANLGGLSLGPLISGAIAQFTSEPLRDPYALDLVLVFVAMAGLIAIPETVQTQGRGLRLHLQRLYIPAEIHAIFVRAAIVSFCGFAVTGIFSAVAPSLLREMIGIQSPGLAGLLVFLLIAAGAAGQLAIRRIPPTLAFAIGCALLVAGLAIVAASIWTNSLALLFVSSIVSGLGWGLTIGFGLVQVNGRVKERRGEVLSTYFVIAYFGLVIPVIGVGVLATAIGLSASGLIFCGATAAIVLAVLGTTRL